MRSRLGYLLFLLLAFSVPLGPKSTQYAISAFNQFRFLVET